MKSTGVVRRIDDLGRIVLPKEIRKTLRIREGESLEIYTNEEEIILKKFTSASDLKETSQSLIDTIANTIRSGSEFKFDIKISYQSCMKEFVKSILNENIIVPIILL